LVETYQLFIDGAWRPGSTGETLPAINPFNQEVWAQVQQASEADVADAVAAARRAYETSWRQTTGLQRATLMHRLADLLEAEAQRMGLLETTDNGKVIRETAPQMVYAARVFRFFAGYADKLYGSVIPLDQRGVMDLALREPYGVIAAITAWNSPVALMANKVPAALAAGNCVVIKPSEHASVTTLEFCRLVEKAGFPPGVINVVTGDARVGKALVDSPSVDKVSFTGSPQVGREIAAQAGRNLRPVTLELGGKSPNIVFADADIDRAVVGALAGIFGATGQTCVAGSRLLVQRPVYEQMVERLAERAKKIVLGDPRDPATEMGTAANEPQFKRILDFIEGAKTEGARLVAGGGAAREGGARQRLLRPADHLRRREQRDARRPGGDLRPRAVDHPVRRRGGGRADRQRLDLRPGLRRLDQGHQPRHADGPRHAHRRGLGEHLPRGRRPGAVRRGEGLRLRPRARRARHPRIHHGQERDDRLLGRGPRPVRHQDMSRRTSALGAA
jgi:aldehyde dehydrogenase (NAD+)